MKKPLLLFFLLAIALLAIYFAFFFPKTQSGVYFFLNEPYPIASEPQIYESLNCVYHRDECNQIKQKIKDEFGLEITYFLSLDRLRIIQNVLTNLPASMASQIIASEITGHPSFTIPESDLGVYVGFNTPDKSLIGVLLPYNVDPNMVEQVLTHEIIENTLVRDEQAMQDWIDAFDWTFNEGKWTRLEGGGGFGGGITEPLVTEYSGTNPTENISEEVSNLLVSPQSYKEIFPKKYEYIVENVLGGQEPPPEGFPEVQ